MSKNSNRQALIRILSLEDRILPSITLVKDINTHIVQEPFTIGDSATVGNFAYFAADKHGYGIELWKWDGTAS